MARKPRSTNSAAQEEIDRVEQQFDNFDAEVKSMTMERMSMAPKEEVEQQTKLSSREIAKSKDITLKPDKVITTHQKFNEKFRDEWEFQKQMVHFIAEHKEIQGDTIELWTRPFGGVSAEFWKVPTNKPVWGPRYLAEQIKRKCYHRLSMEENRIVSQDGMGSYTGQLVVDKAVQRLDAIPVSSRKSVFMSGDF